MIQKIDELKELPIIGKEYMVSCLVGTINFYNKIKKKVTIPIYNNFHSDYESGQKEKHYHVDFRFIKPNYIFPYSTRIDEYYIKENNLIFTYRNRILYNNESVFKTHYEIIKNSKLKHKCIYKGKCPHRGYPLNTEVPVNGIITCPLHGLMFEENTKQLIQ